MEAEIASACVEQAATDQKVAEAQAEADLANGRIRKQLLGAPSGASSAQEPAQEATAGDVCMEQDLANDEEGSELQRNAE